MQNVRVIEDDADLTGLLAASRPSAIIFYADWCPDCRRFKPSFSSLAKAYGRNIQFLSVDVAKLPELEEKYVIGLIPTVLLFQEGKLTRTWEFVEAIDSYRQCFDQLSTRRA
jgi:thiol-disulfide isomerase/thioredoxin